MASDRLFDDEGQCFKLTAKYKGICVTCYGVGPGPGSLGTQVRSRVGLAGLPGPRDLIDQKFDALDALLLTKPLPAADVLSVQIDKILADIDALADGDLRQFLLDGIIRDQRTAARLEPFSVSEKGNAPSYPVKYVATILRPSGPFYIRGETKPYGQYSIFVPRDGLLVGVDFYDPVRARTSHIIPDFRPEAVYALPRFTLVPLDSTAQDTDGDGLPDVVEFVYGTDPNKADTDGDGISDGVEVAQGTNPLDGQPAASGAVATINSGGIAIDVCAVNDLVFVANSDHGVAIFDVHNPAAPLLVAVAGPADPALSVSAGGGFLAVANGPAGVSLFDVSQPSQPGLNWQTKLSGTVQAVTRAGPLTVAGQDSGEIVVLNEFGEILNSLKPGGATPIQDLAVSEGVVYALQASKLHALSLADGGLTLASSTPWNGVQGASFRLRLFAAANHLLATSTSGYSVFDLSDPLLPVKMLQNDTAQFGWRHIVLDGSGLALAAVSANPGDPVRPVSLYDVGTNATKTIFLTTFSTAGSAAAVCVYKGYGMVADSGAGLTVLDYQARDAGNQPPAITLTGTFDTANQASETTDLRVNALAQDDVRVRSVEFYLDGSLAEADGNFPFEAYLLAPMPSATKTNFVVQAKATDTGGNFAWSTPQSFQLLPALRPPEVFTITTSPGQPLLTGFTFALNARFKNPIAPGSLTPQSSQLLSGGQPVAGGVVALADDGRTATLTFAAGLPTPGQYTFVLSSGITSLGGIPLPAAVTYPVNVIGPKLWISDQDGDWGNTNNWSDLIRPGTNDYVLIDRPGANPLIHLVDQNPGTFGLAGRLLLCREDVDFTPNASALEIEGSAEFDGSLTIHTNAFGTFRGGHSILRGPLQNLNILQLASGHLMELAPSPAPHLFDGASAQLSTAQTFQQGVRASELRTLDGSVLELHSTDFALNGFSRVRISGDTSGSEALDALFQNDGELRKTGPGVVAIDTIRFVNNGLVDVQEGLLQMGSFVSSFRHDGRYQISPAATLQLITGNHLFGRLANLAGEGKLEVNSSANFAGDYNFAGLTRVSGKLELRGSVRSTGPWSVRGGVTFSGLSTELTGPVTLSGGSLALNSPTETVLPNLVLSQEIVGLGTFSGGTLKGSGRVRLTGSLIITNALNLGDPTFGDRLETVLDAAVDIRSDLTMNSRIGVAFNGATVWHAGLLRSDTGNGDPVIASSGSFEMAADATWICRNIVNRGTLSKTSTGITTLDVRSTQAVFSNAGLVSVNAGSLALTAGSFQQTAGETRLAGGNLLFNPTPLPPFQFKGGRLTGSGTLGGALQVSGSTEIAPGAPIGTLTISDATASGNFMLDVQDTNSFISIDIAGPAPGTGHDQIVVNGDVSVQGTLNVRLLNSYLPAIGDSFTILKCTRLDSAQFNQIVGADFTPGRAFKVNYAPTGADAGVVLEVVASP
ncbi:MAG: hypothetical protein ABI651_01130 [Verrucomicrobiota bacterium]